MRELLVAQHPLGSEQLRSSLARLPSHARDAWVDAVLGVGDLAADEPTLPRGCTPYYPCSVDAILRAIELTELDSEDVFVDIGSGVGRAITLAHLLTGATSIGIEIQHGLVESARAIARKLELTRVTTVEGDAADSSSLAPNGTVYFLYAPFSGPRLERVFDQLDELAKTRSIAVCGVQLPTMRRPRLELASSESDELVLYRGRH